MLVLLPPQLPHCHPVVTFLRSLPLLSRFCLFLFVCFFPPLFAHELSFTTDLCPPLMHRCLPEFEWRGCDRMACPPGYLERCGGASYATDQENYPLPPNNQSHRREERVRKCKNFPTW